ncbi:hypothetical protein psb1_0097 [Shigella phage pSb-1]|uniref:Uncharacterized protein n=1 Tax=Shigella phage pSb-1 TaxID=1414738 RepID=V5UQ46_9CAUD|nr:hypothetical protein psb1_0097 [Shigella phage pSb-1]AHB79515.1 hypothetical protein psb1_0097 [Shigella phage pSb-1]
MVERRKASREQGVCGHWFESSSGYSLIENIVLIALHSKDNAGETVRHSSYCKHAYRYEYEQTIMLKYSYLLSDYQSCLLVQAPVVIVNWPSLVSCVKATKSLFGGTFLFEY